jgi:hypothetical protein
MTARFTPESRVIDVVNGSPEGRNLLYKHGYRLGEGFVDGLSQFQRLAEAETMGRLRDLDGLLTALNAEKPKASKASR